MGSIIAIGNAILTTIMSGGGAAPSPSLLITEATFVPANDQIVDENGVDLTTE